MYDIGDRAFRARLKQALPAWRREGLIDADAERRLVERHRLDEDDGAHLATTAVYVIGALLVGGGVISLVAWNWAALPAAAKLLLVSSAMVALHVEGYRRWKLAGSAPRLGQALTFIGTLVFGANIGLVAQIFHVSGAWFNGALAWAAGALVAAWAYGSVAHGVLALLTALIGWGGLASRFPDVVWATPLLFAALFGPLAWRQRSRLLFFLVAGAVACSLPLAVADVGRSVGPVALNAGLTVAALLAWPALARPGSTAARFGPTARFVGFYGFVSLAFVLAFVDVARELNRAVEGAPALAWLAALAPLAVLALGRLDAARLRAMPCTLAALATTPALVGALYLDGALLAVLANLSLAALSAVAITSAVNGLERGPFWSGALLAGVLVVSRFFEFETGLWLKALAFITAGVALIAVGVAFERRLREVSDVAA